MPHAISGRVFSHRLTPHTHFFYDVIGRNRTKLSSITRQICPHLYSQMTQAESAEGLLRLCPITSRREMHVSIKSAATPLPLPIAHPFPRPQAVKCWEGTWHTTVAPKMVLSMWQKQVNTNRLECWRKIWVETRRQVKYYAQRESHWTRVGQIMCW